MFTFTNKPYNMRSSTLFSYLMDTFQPEAKVNEQATYKHTSAIVSHGKVIAVATNRIGAKARARKTGPRYDNSPHGSCTIHAEIAAIRSVGDLNRLRGADMYVWRISTALGRPGNSKPCAECQCVLEKCMREFGLRNVYYSCV